MLRPKSADAAVESASSTKDMFRDDQRAWVGPVSFGTPTPPIDVGNQPQVAVKIINSGKTPALKFKVKFTTRESPKDVIFLADYKALPLGTKQTIAVILPNVNMMLNTVPRGRKFERRRLTR